MAIAHGGLKPWEVDRFEMQELENYIDGVAVANDQVPKLLREVYYVLFNTNVSKKDRLSRAGLLKAIPLYIDSKLDKSETDIRVEQDEARERFEAILKELKKKDGQRRIKSSIQRPNGTGDAGS